MQEILIRKLHEYISENNPDLLLVLQQENKVTEYLQKNVLTVDTLLNQLLAEDRPLYDIEEQCMDLLTHPLRPSRFTYLKTILEENFKEDYERFNQNGILTIEVINLIAICDPVFEETGFNDEEEEDWYLRYIVIGAVQEYITGN